MSKISTHPNLVAYKFGDAFLNTFDRTLSKNGKQLEVFAKTFDLLLLLVKNAGAIITKDQILDEVWSENFVEEQNLTVHISKLRKLLGANKNEPFIKTIKGKGYQFVSNVEVITNTNKNNSSKIGRDDNVKSVSLAILPIKNENGDEEIEYLADGLTESLINSLSFTKNFNLSARDSVFHYKNTKLSAQEIGENLGVATILTGRLKVFKDNLIVGVELVNVSDGTQIWGTQINESFADIFIMQEKLTIAISNNLKSNQKNTKADYLPNRITENTESFRFYLKGRYFRENCGFFAPVKAIEYFKESIAEDATNAHSYVGLAESYYWSFLCDYKTYDEMFPLIHQYLDRAIELNSDIPEISLLRAKIAMADWEFNKADESFQNIIEQNPSFIEAHYQYAHLHTLLGNFPKALRILQKTTKLTTISSKNLLHIARIYHHTGQFEKAINKLEEVLEFDSNNTSGLSLLSLVMCSIGRYEEAIEIAQKATDIHYDHDLFAQIGYANAKANKRSVAYEVIEKLTKKSKTNYIPPTYLGTIYSALGENDKAFEALEKAFETKETDIVRLKIDSRFTTLRDDPRFDNLLEKIGLL